LCALVFVMQLHDGLKKLHVRPSIELSPEDFDDFAGNGCEKIDRLEKRWRWRLTIYFNRHTEIDKGDR
jgi:hypothetical protein